MPCIDVNFFTEDFTNDTTAFGDALDARKGGKKRRGGKRCMY